MKRFLITAVVILSSVSAALAGPTRYFSVNSPDGTLKATVKTGSSVSWSLAKDGVSVLSESEISMTLSDGTVYGGSLDVSSSRTRSVRQTINTVSYKKAVVDDVYNELTLKFKGFDLVFRAYDEGVAYRFVSKSETPITILSEQAQFVFPVDYKAYVPYVNAAGSLEKQFDNSFENEYSHIPISQWDKKRLAFLPIAVEAGDFLVSITESDVVDYPGMYLYSGSSEGDGSVNVGPSTKESGLKAVFAPYPKEIEQGGHNNLQALVTSRENYIAKARAEASFPWRIVNVAREHRDLLDSDMVFRLARAMDTESDFSWVKPGKVAWDWWNDWNIYGVDFKAGINNETYKYYIDFASQHGIEYVILDEGWAVNMKADLFEVVPEINLKELVRYADSKRVGLILWAGYWAFNKDMEKVCKTYSEMGIKGFKVDFMNRDDQPMMSFYAKAAQMGAKYHLLMDFHGAPKPVGLQRMYPNILNYEGVNGLEQMKWSGPSLDQVTYDVTIPFVRMVAGSMDYTQGAMKNASRGSYSANYSEPQSQGTRCHQLAEYVIFDAPLTMLCDSPTNYMAEPECTEFIAGIPTTWDRTIALDGKIADYAVMARQKGDSWYVGALNGWGEKDVVIDLGFIPSGNYDMIVFRDGVNANKAAKDYTREKIVVPFSRKLTIHMASGGGWVARIVKR